MSGPAPSNPLTPEPPLLPVERESGPGGVRCAHCRAVLPPELHNRDDLVPCPGCGHAVLALAFPALYREDRPGQDGEALLLPDEAGCFYHPAKKAVRPCGACGRFLCALCDCEIHGRHLCPPCLESGRLKGRLPDLESHRTLYDNVALSLAILPLLVFYFTVATAPMAIYVAIRHWKSPLSVVRRSRYRFVFALLLAVTQIGGWIALVVYLVSQV